ncbi:hypothetical protein ABI59_21755 [Acidobacteria bacterium Mor1]|nr:hypothetical protein ABI59_21755 [Acidobacteria bacterium Mor1]
MNATRWNLFTERWGTEPDDEAFAELHAAYSESHRKYHSAAHIEDCLDQFDQAVELAEHPLEIETAIWFHDAIYEPMSSDNELKSAQWADRWLRSVGAGEEPRQRVHHLIMATLHTTGELVGDAALMVDIDLSILGREPEVFARYENAIRQEYRWVPGPLFRRKRVEILKSFLDRPRIYALEHFQARYEQQARKNLERVIANGGRWNSPG